MLDNRLKILRQATFVIKQMSYRENKKKVDETNLGLFWNILNPILFMIILSMYYQNVIIHKIENFPVFVFSGITIMNYYNSATKGAMHSLVSNKRLIIKSKLPVEVFILQKIIVPLRELFFSGLSLIVIMFFFRIEFSWRVLQIIPVLFLTIITVMGIGEILSVIYVFFADIDYFYSVFMTLMLFVSGVFIPIKHLPEKVHTVLTYNPIFLSIYLSRNCFVYNLSSHWSAWAKLCIWAVVLSLIGKILFLRNKNAILLKL
jgi:lipopolysaccharide transport system permease protein